MTTRPPETRPSIAIPWGPGASLPLEIPETWDVAGVAWPDLSGAIEDYPAALRHAIDQPEGELNIDEIVREGSTVAIVVDDPSRWTPVREAFPVLLERLHELGVRPGDVTISVGVGRHHAVDAKSMRRRVGEAVADAHRCFSPPVDDLSEYDDLGTTPEGSSGPGLSPRRECRPSGPDRVRPTSSPGGVSVAATS